MSYFLFEYAQKTEKFVSNKTSVFHALGKKY